MVTWENLDKQDSYKKLMSLKGQVILKDVLDGERVKSYSVPMAAGLTYKYASKQVNEQIITVFNIMNRNEKQYFSSEIDECMKADYAYFKGSYNKLTDPDHMMFIEEVKFSDLAKGCEI